MNFILQLAREAYDQKPQLQYEVYSNRINVLVSCSVLHMTLCGINVCRMSQVYMCVTGCVCVSVCPPVYLKQGGPPCLNLS